VRKLHPRDDLHMPRSLFGPTLASLRFAVLPLVLVVVSFMFLQSEVFVAGGTLANGAVVAGSITGGGAVGADWPGGSISPSHGRSR
jgi:hypothetical protein